jgi:hypothetical protein
MYHQKERCEPRPTPPITTKGKFKLGNPAWHQPTHMHTKTKKKSGYSLRQEKLRGEVPEEVNVRCQKCHGGQTKRRY